MIVAPDTQVTMVFTNKANDAVIMREETVADLIGACATRVSITLNALSMSGGVLWRHPITGETYPQGVSWHLELVDPDSGEVVTAVPS